MSTDLKTQIRDYGEQLIDSQVPINESVIAELVDRVRELPPPLIPQRRSRNLWVAVSAAALVLVVVGGLALIASFSRTAGPADQPSATTVPQSTTVPEMTELLVDEPTPSTVPTVEGLSWMRVPHDDDLFEAGSVIFSMAVSDGRFVAVGSDSAAGCRPPSCLASQDGSAAVWTSSDGVTWARVPHDESVFGGPGGQEMWAVTAWHGGFVAVGVDGGSPDLGSSPDHTSQVAAVWTSPDGLSWSRVPRHEAIFGGPGRQEMWGVAASETGIVAIGFDAEGPMSGSQEDQAIWVSQDGTTWTQVPPGFGVGIMNDIAASAIGFIGVGESSGAAVWTSPDGRSWTPIPQGPVDRDGSYMASVSVSETGYVAAGGLGYERQPAAAWTSPDGLGWTRVSGSENMFPDVAGDGYPHLAIAARGTAASPSVMIAGGTDPMEPVESSVWVSIEGEAWMRAMDEEGVFEGASFHALALSGSTVVAAGTVGELFAGDLHAAIWIGLPDGGG